MAKDLLPKGISVSALQIASNSCSDNSGLDPEIEIKEGARIMLTKNISIADRLMVNLALSPELLFMSSPMK